VPVRKNRVLALTALLVLPFGVLVALGQEKQKKPPAEAPKQEEQKKPPAEEAKQPEPKQPPVEDPKQAEQKKPPAEDAQQAYEELKEKAEREYRLFFKRPENTLEYWAAIRFEIEDGKFDVAAFHLKQLLEKQPADKVDDDLLTIEAKEGLAPFTRLRMITKWSKEKAVQEDARKNVETLIQRVTGALEKRLSDRERINKFIKSLEGATAEERQFALAQLKRSGARAAPLLIAALRNTAGTTQNQRLQSAIVQLGPDALAPLFDVLRARNAQDAKDTELRIALMDIFKRAGDRRAVPYLWHVSSSLQYPAAVRQKARQTLGYLLETNPERLPAAQSALTRIADDHFQNKVVFADPKRIPVWKWDGKTLADEPVILDAAQANLYYGLLFAREALDLDPGYQPAQSVFLSLALVQANRDRIDPTTPVKVLNPALERLVRTVDIDLLTQVLDRALRERRIPVILGAIRALGERADVRAARPGNTGEPRGLQWALYFPDRRVQIAAANALLRIGASQPSQYAARVVDILRRFVAADPAPRAVVAYVPDDKANEIQNTLKAIGYEPVIVPGARQVLEDIHRAAGADVILFYSGMPSAELPYALAQLRADSDAGLLPLLILSAKAGAGALDPAARRLNDLVSKYEAVWVIPDAAARLPEEMKRQIDMVTNPAALQAQIDKHLVSNEQKPRVERFSQLGLGQGLSTAERKLYAGMAMDWLWRISRGEVKGYDLRPTVPALAEALRNPDLALPAIETLAHIPGLEPQQRLLGVVLDPKRGPLRSTAALQLNRHIQDNGLLLQKGQIDQVRGIYNNQAESPVLREQLATVIGALGSTPRQTGQELYRYTPQAVPVPAPPPQPGPMPKDEKEKQ
jgi:hypothetical protein